MGRLRGLIPEIAFGAAAFGFLLLFPLANGYPFLFPDSWGYYGACPDEMRSPVLGCALKPVTAFFGPWGYVVAQSAAAAAALAFLWGRVLGRRHTAAAAAALLLSGLGLYTGFLMADCWTLLALIGLFAAAAGRRGAAAFLLLSFGAAAHFGNLPVLASTAALVLPRARGRGRYLAFVAAGLLGALILIAGVNLLGGSLRLTSGNGAVFLASRTLHDVPAVLERHCAERPASPLCERPEEVLAWSAAEHQSFTWTAYYRLGRSWEALARESRALLAAGLLGPTRLLWEQAAAALRNTARLALLPEVSNGFEPFPPGSPAVEDLRACHPGDVAAFLGSLQGRGELERALRALDRPVMLLVWAALALCLAGAAAGRRLAAPLSSLTLFALAAAVSNAFWMGFLSGVYGRYQARILFILFLPAAALLARGLSRRLRNSA
jgi:hypothetical protein